MGTADVVCGGCGCGGGGGVELLTEVESSILTSGEPAPMPLSTLLLLLK